MSAGRSCVNPSAQFSPALAARKPTRILISTNGGMRSRAHQCVLVELVELVELVADPASSLVFCPFSTCHSSLEPGIGVHSLRYSNAKKGEERPEKCRFRGENAALWARAPRAHEGGQASSFQGLHYYTYHCFAPPTSPAAPGLTTTKRK
ncbi:hypothetical protein N431DRAFT_552261 [Stipitochalara longipes BDJ]|nr:hypothetical protein N431DRAFT_552261 [Stipitochalara longipes BDJ]